LALAAALGGLLTLGLAAAPAQATPGTLGTGAAPAQATLGTARTPPMGWNGYNQYRDKVTEAIVRANAAALVSSGLAALGYRYVLLDGGWAAPTRDAAGNLQADPARFPHGIPALAAYVHSLGLKFGIYENAGLTNYTGTAAGGYPDHYAQDAATFARWGVDYVKFDYPKVPGLPFFGPGNPALAKSLAAKMAAGIAATGRPMVFDVNDAGGNGARFHDLDWTWAWSVGASLWRTGTDIRASYSSIYHKIFGEYGSLGAKNLAAYAGPGGWNDPDYLEVGNGDVTGAIAKTQLSLWAMEAAPLIEGHDIATLSATDRAALANTGLIAIDQDRAGIAGRSVRGMPRGLRVLYRPLANGDWAVALFNARPSARRITTSARQVGMPADSRGYTLTNIWGGQVTTTGGRMSHVVHSRSTVLYRVRRR
jgi:alpha-galactosidase